MFNVKQSSDGGPEVSQSGESTVDTVWIERHTRYGSFRCRSCKSKRSYRRFREGDAKKSSHLWCCSVDETMDSPDSSIDTQGTDGCSDFEDRRNEKQRSKASSSAKNREVEHRNR